MRVAVVVEHIDTWRGGAETSTVQFIHGLCAHGIDVDVYTRSGECSDDVPFRLHTIGITSRSVMHKTYAFSRAVDQRLHDHDYDVVHAITPCTTANIYQPRGGTIPETMIRTIDAHRGLGKILKRAFMAVEPKRRLMSRLEREVINGDNEPQIIAISDYVARQFAQHYALSHTRVSKIFNGVQIKARSEPKNSLAIREIYRVPNSHILALMVAHNFRLKGLDCWLDAISDDRNRRSAITLLVVGKDDPTSYLRRLRRINTRHQVVFVGPTTLISAFMAQADVLVHPTHYDPCSRVVLEAMLTGLPCVTTRYNGAHEIIEDGITGRTIDDPRNGTALIQAVEDVHLGPYRTELLAQRETLESELSMARHVRQVIALYDRTISSK